jgi:cytochrome c1
MKRKLLLIVIALATVLAGCGLPEETMVERDFPQGNAEARRQQIIDYGCGACHTIDGIPGANGVVGPPLVNYEERHYIAGELTNNAANLIQWIQNPKAIEPDTAMPNLGVSRQEAIDMVAYFYS